MLRSALSTLNRAARPLSTAAALPAEPPIALFGVAGRYATALYSAAAKKNELLAVEADLATLAQAFETSPALKAFAADPGVPRAAKAKAFVEALGSAGACTTTKNAFAAVCEGGRMRELPKIVKMYADLMAAAKGEVSAIVTTATKPTKAELQEINAKVNSVLEAGQTKVNIVTKVNPGLIDGMTIEIGDKFIDYSVASQLKKLVQLLGVSGK